MKKVVLFTACVEGGILQFTLQLYKELKKLGFNTKVFLPMEIENCHLDENWRKDIVQYHKVRKVIDKSSYRQLAIKINQEKPEYVWYMDDSVIGSDVGLYLECSIKQLLTLHDAGTHHPTYHKNFRTIILEWYVKMVNFKFYKKVTRFILLSSESMKTFTGLYPNYENKAVMMNLGAHLPDVEEIKPQEMKFENGYLLFFGRIDRYKGIGNLVKAYKNVNDRALPLVIAGNGQFTKEEKQLINNCRNLTVINRYIADGEMKWLLHHMSAAVLPYIEATQSGIIPLAYLFGKPVIVSNVPGLTQFVIHGQTGYICRSEDDWEKKLLERKFDEMTEQIYDFYMNNMDWENNVKKMFEAIEGNIREC